MQTDRLSDLMLDTRHALSTIDEDERIRILWKMKRSCLETLMAIGTSYMPDMRYTPLPYASDMPAPCIPQMSSSHAAHMLSFFDLQMSRPSSSYMPQMTTSDPSWYHNSLFEWSDFFVTGPSLDSYEGAEEVTQFVDAPAASVIPDMHVQEMSIVTGEEPSQLIEEQERPLRTFVRRSKWPRAPRCPYETQYFLDLYYYEIFL